MKKIINIILLITWLLLIFIFSAQNEEETIKTSGVFDVVINIVVKDEALKPTAKYIVRKFAHFTEYFILSLLILNVIKDYKVIDYRWLIFTMIMCILYAISDESHQLFVDGRVGRAADVLIDSSGSLFALICYKIVKKFKSKR